MGKMGKMGTMGKRAAEPGRGWKILVVDDEEKVQRLAKECIRLALGDQHAVVLASDGETAISAASQQRPDLILLDIAMPGTDGFEVCRRLKASPATSDIPVVFLTGRGDQEAVEEGLALGGDAYVVKPFNAVTLAAQISELLAPREEKRE